MWCHNFYHTITTWCNIHFLPNYNSLYLQQSDATISTIHVPLVEPNMYQMFYQIIPQSSVGLYLYDATISILMSHIVPHMRHTRVRLLLTKAVTMSSPYCCTRAHIYYISKIIYYTTSILYAWGWWPTNGKGYTGWPECSQRPCWRRQCMYLFYLQISSVPYDRIRGMTPSQRPCWRRQGI